jgi:uncharacterized transporter YbjL
VTIVSATVFDWFLTLMTGVLAGAWVVYDARNMVKLRTADGSDPIVRDKRFGYAMGMLIGLVGVVGVMWHHLR